MAHKKKQDPDYTLNIFPLYDQKAKRDVIVFLVQTTKIFVSFRYEILLESEIYDHTIKLNITGLHVPELLMPQTGPAQGRRDFIELNGIFRVIVVKQDRTENEFMIQISQELIDIKKKPKNPFILISNDPINLS
jgi:hypothetical protein